MPFQNITENPQESTVVINILGLLFADGLNAIDAGVLGRFFIYLGEVLTTISVFMVAQEAKENTQVQQSKEIKENAIISELQQQNQSLQEQIWVLQELLSSIQNKL